MSSEVVMGADGNLTRVEAERTYGGQKHVKHYAGPLVVLVAAIGFFTWARAEVAEARWYYRQTSDTQQKILEYNKRRNLKARQLTRTINRELVNNVIKGGYLDLAANQLYFNYGKLDKSFDLQTACPYWHELTIEVWTSDKVRVRQAIMPVCPTDAVAQADDYHDLHGISWRGLNREEYHKITYLLVYSSLDAKNIYRVWFGNDQNGMRELTKVEEIPNPYWHR